MGCQGDERQSDGGDFFRFRFSLVPDAPLFQVQDVEARTMPREVVREDVRAALEGAGITGCRFVPIVRVRLGVCVYAPHDTRVARHAPCSQR